MHQPFAVWIWPSKRKASSILFTSFRYTVLSDLTYETSISMPIPPIWPKNSTAVTSEPSLDHTEPLEKGHNNLLSKLDFRAWLQTSTKKGLRILPFTRSLYHKNERFYEADALATPPTTSCNSTLSLWEGVGGNEREWLWFSLFEKQALDWDVCINIFSKMLSWIVGNPLCQRLWASMEIKCQIILKFWFKLNLLNSAFS